MTARRALEWIALILAGAAAAAVLQRLAVPAPWLIGPVVVAIAAASSGLVELRVPPGAFAAAQAAIGMLIAQTFTPPVVA